jgi:hypothetical protein
MSNTAFKIYDLAEELGWTSRVEGASETTSSLYVEISRRIDLPDDEYDYEEIHVRISNHGHAHLRDDGRETFYIRTDLDADADIERLRRRLSQPRRAPDA